MANENDVVRLKHLNSLTSVVHNITLHSGGASLPDNADFALYVPNDTSIIITGKQAPVLSLGSWSAVDTVYSAPITYTGDGTLSTDIGTIANDILTVEDVDGNFNGIIFASSGYDYAATKTNFSYNSTEVIIPPKPIPSLVLGSWSAVDSVYFAPISYSGDGALSVNIGSISNGSLTVEDSDGKFSGVISAAEGDNFNETYLAFNYNTDTITTTVIAQSGEDRFQKILNGCPDYEVAGSSSITLFYGGLELSLAETEDKNFKNYSAYDNNGNEVIGTSIVKGNSTLDHCNVGLIKFNELSCGLYVADKLKNGSYYYDGKKTLSVTYIEYNEDIAWSNDSTDTTICAAVSSIAASMESSNVTFCRSIFSSDDILAFIEKTGVTTTTQTIQHWVSPLITSTRSLIKAPMDSSTTLSASYQNNSTPTYELKKAWNAEYSFVNDKVVVKKGINSRLTPIVIHNTPEQCSYINLGKTGVGGTSTTLGSYCARFFTNYENPFKQEGEILLGVWPDKANSSCYIITFKEGTYDADTWIDNCFTVWGICRTGRGAIEFKIIKLNLKITDIVDEILL